jgi:alanine racemase
MDTAAYSTWIEVDLEAIRNNLHELRRISGVKVMAVVKANGYGHGIVETARAAEQGGAAWLGVARIEEALALRAAQIASPILVLGYTAPLRAREAALNGISLAVYDPDLAAAYSAEGMKVARRICVHAKFDTGMGRLGAFPEEGLDFIQRLMKLPGIELEGMFTHFARSDEPEFETTHWQISRFQALVGQLSQAGLRPPLVHAANSAAALYFPEARYDLVRCGIAIYGLDPSAQTPLPNTFRTALTWKAHLASVKVLPENHGVGYSYRYVTQHSERIGTVAVGYADGFRRRVGNFALVGGKRVKVAGGVCMDQMMLQLDDVPEARAGDEVVLIGQQGDQVIRAEEIGGAWNSVNYDVVCGLQARVPRLYLNQDDGAVL